MSDAEWEELLEGFDERGYLSARRWRPGDDPYALYAFNQRESERIPSNRALRDTRHYRYTPITTNAHLYTRQSPERQPATTGTHTQTHITHLLTLTHTH